MGLLNRFFHVEKKERRVTEKGVTKRNPVVRQISFQVANLQMVGAREHQEDSFAILNALDVTQIIREGLFAVVCDGMGGMRDGKQVSQAAVSELTQLFRDLDRDGDIPGQLCNGASEINARLFESFSGGGGTTAVAVLIYQGKLYWLSVGDSAIFLKRGSSFLQLNQEHNLENQLYLQEIHCDTIDRESVERNPEKARLSEFLGIDRLDEVDCNLRPLHLQVGDVLLLCSDGISGFLSEKEIKQALALAPDQACAYLQEQIEKLQAKHQDNYTGIVIACCN